MKKITSLKILAAFAFACVLTLLQPAAARAADDKKMQECTMAADGKLMSPEGKPMGDCMMMRAGKMEMYHDGKFTVMDHEMTMDNGTKCLPDGTCTMKDGTKMKLSEGDVMDHVNHIFHTKGLRAPDGTYR